MNNYITLDSLKYKVPHNMWIPAPHVPTTIRVTLAGSLDTTYGPASTLSWQGMIIGPVTPEDTGWGDIDDLRVSLAKRTTLSYTDHYGDNYTVAHKGPFPEESRTPMWDGTSNEILVTVSLLAVS